MTPSTSPRLRPHHAVLLEFDRPLTQRQHEMLASNIHPVPHLAAVWHAGPDLVAGILVVRGRDALLAGYAASCTCLSALGSAVPVRIAAVVRTDLVWPPAWWSTQP